jgi:hypothetical protein
MFSWIPPFLATLLLEYSEREAGDSGGEIIYRETEERVNE